MADKGIQVSVQPKNVYGLRSEVIGNIQFNQDQEVIYPVEGVIAFHDYVTNKQKFLRLPEKTIPLIIAISPSRRLLAILEQTTIELTPNVAAERKFIICIYDLTTIKKRRTFVLPENDEFEYKVSCMSFTYDSKALAVLTKPPEEQLFLFMFDKADTVLQGRAANTNQRGTADCIACNLMDNTQFAIGGDNVFKLMTKSEKGITITTNIKSDGLYIISMIWLTNDTVLAGTIRGTLLIIEGPEIKAKLDARTIEIIDLMKDHEEEMGIESDSQLSIAESDTTTESRVMCMTLFPRGFAFAIFNMVYVFEKETKYKFQRKTILTIKIDIYPEMVYQIRNLAVNLAQDTVIATTDHNQIYVAVLIVPETLKTIELNFKTLGEYIHIDEIIDVSVCSWRTIIMTASKDQTIRIWNYETEKIELVKKYQVDLTVIELNPTGLFAAVGFSDQLRLVQIFMQDLRIMKTYNFPRCKDVKFSNLGHMMAAAYDNVIAITSVYSLEIIRILRGHNGDVLSVAWSRDDKYLVSGGIEGAVYQWDVDNGKRVHEVVEKGVEYRGVSISHDPQSIYAVTSMGTLREIANSEVLREIKTPNDVPLLSLTLARSDLVMFLSSEQGHLYNIQLPFLEAGGGKCTNYRFFDSAVTKLVISHDGTLLITASRKGTLAIWVLRNIEGRVAPMDQDLLKCQEVLIPRAVLQDRIDTIANLELRLKQQLAEFQYQISQNEIFDEQVMADVHKSYLAAMEELKAKNNQMEQDHVTELNEISTHINSMTSEHEQAMQILAAQYSDRMLSEYHKFTHLRENMIEMRNSYEDKLRKSAGCLQDTIEALETDFKKQLQERQELIRQLMQEMDDKKTEFIEYCGQVEMDNDRNMVESQLHYEKKLKNEQDATLEWRGEAGVLKKKFNAISKEAEELREECDVLKEEHKKFKKEIDKHVRGHEDLRRELEERDFIINEKEKRIQEVMSTNQELEKYKQVLSHKIDELKAQIEPRERQIKEKRDQIVEMERELEGLNLNNLQLELQLRELRDKYVGNVNELKLERDRSRQSRSYSMKICADIFHVAGDISQPEKLREGVRSLYKKYGDDRELKKSIILDAQVQSEFQRQRNHLEGMITTMKKREAERNQKGKTLQLISENSVLLEELNQLRRNYKISRQTMMNIENLIGGGFKHISPVVIRAKIKKAVTDVDKLQEAHQLDIKQMEFKLLELVEENKILQAEITNLKEPQGKGDNVSEDGIQKKLQNLNYSMEEEEELTQTDQ